MVGKVKVSIERGIAELRFNRPECLNALDLDTAMAFRAAIARAVDDRTVRVIVLSGEGRTFVSGGDLAHLRAASDRPAAARKLIGVMHEGLQVLHDSGIPSIAALKGNVAGAGVSLGLMTTLAVAAENTKLNMAYIRVAATPDCGGSWALTRLVGPRRAAEIALLAEPIDANRALQLGLVNRLAPTDATEEVAREMAAHIASAPSLAARQTLSLIAGAAGDGLVAQLAKEMEAFAACAGISDFAEALDAFFDKRKPVFDKS